MRSLKTIPRPKSSIHATHRAVLGFELLEMRLHLSSPSDARSLLSATQKFATPGASTAAVATVNDKPAAVTAQAIVPSAPIAVTAASGFADTLSLSWTGTAPLYEVYRWQGIDAPVLLGTITATHFIDSSNLAPNENYFYNITADYGNGINATSTIAAGTPLASLKTDFTSPIVISPNPVEGGVATVRAITNLLTPFSSGQISVYWGDGQTSDFISDSSHFGTFGTLQPFTTGISATHLYSHGGTYAPVITMRFASGDEQTLYFGVPYTPIGIVLPGALPVVTTAAKVVSMSGATANLSVAGIATGGVDTTYEWTVVGQPASAISANFGGDPSADTASTTITFHQPGLYTLQAAIDAVYGFLYTTSILKIRVTQQLTSLFVSTANVSVPEHGSYQFQAIALDQFGDPMLRQPRIDWSLEGSSAGRISSSGRFRALGGAGSVQTVDAIAGNTQTGYVSARFQVTIMPPRHQPIHVPAPVTQSFAEADDNNSIMLSWTPGDNTADGFIIESSYDLINYAPIGTAPAGQNVFLITNLIGADYAYIYDYNFRIVPYNAVGSGKSVTSNLVFPQAHFTSMPISGGITGRPGRVDSVALTNLGPAQVPAGYVAGIYASLDSALDTAVLVGSMISTTPLASGATSYFSIRSILPTNMPTGPYRLTAAITERGNPPLLIAGEIASYKTLKRSRGSR